MPRYLRWKITGATYFFTVVTHQRRPFFQHANYRRLLGASFRDARKRWPFEIDAVVLLPDHLHVLMRPADGVDYSNIWRRVKTFFSDKMLADRREKEKCALQENARYTINGASQKDAPYEKTPRGEARRKGEANIWQRRFYEHTIRDDEDWGRHVDYIHWNPVKHGLVKRPQDWRWSSIHRYIATGLLVPDWPGDEELQFPFVRE